MNLQERWGINKMTENKPIIIDGVDVSGCDELVNECDCYLTQEHDYRSVTPYTYTKCSGFPNCNFKQLARKTQECEKLREANDEKNEFLKKLGISATGEFHRIKHYIDKMHQKCKEVKNEH